MIEYQIELFEILMMGAKAKLGWMVLVLLEKRLVNRAWTAVGLLRDNQWQKIHLPSHRETSQPTGTKVENQ